MSLIPKYTIWAIKELVGNTAVYIGNNIYNKKVNSRKRGVHNIYGLTGNADHLVEVNPVLRFYLHLCLFGLSYIGKEIK